MIRVMRVFGVGFTADAILLIDQTLDEDYWICKRSLPCHVCQRSDGRAANGRLDSMKHFSDACIDGYSSELGHIDIELITSRHT